MLIKKIQSLHTSSVHCTFLWQSLPWDLPHYPSHNSAFHLKGSPNTMCVLIQHQQNCQSSKSSALTYLELPILPNLKQQDRKEKLAHKCTSLIQTWNLLDWLFTNDVSFPLLTDFTFILHVPVPLCSLSSLFLDSSVFHIQRGVLLFIPLICF